MSNQFSEDQRKFIISSFRQLDTDNDGKLTRDQIKELIRDMGVCKDDNQIDQIIDEVDTDRNKTIELGQFMSLMDKLSSSITDDDDIIECFKILNSKHEEGITFQGLKQIFSKMEYVKMNDEDIKNMIIEADLDGDGKVSLQQFKKLLKR